MSPWTQNQLQCGGGTGLKRKVNTIMAWRGYAIKWAKTEFVRSQNTTPRSSRWANTRSLCLHRRNTDRMCVFTSPPAAARAYLTVPTVIAGRSTKLKTASCFIRNLRYRSVKRVTVVFLFFSKWIECLKQHVVLLLLILILTISSYGATVRHATRVDSYIVGAWIVLSIISFYYGCIHFFCNSTTSSSCNFTTTTKKENSFSKQDFYVLPLNWTLILYFFVYISTTACFKGCLFLLAVLTPTTSRGVDFVGRPKGQT